MPGSSEEDFFIEIHHFVLLFTPKLPPFGVRSYEIYNFLSPFPKNAKYQIWLNIGSVVVEKMLTDEARRMTHDNSETYLPNKL